MGCDAQILRIPAQSAQQDFIRRSIILLNALAKAISTKDGIIFIAQAQVQRQFRLQFPVIQEVEAVPPVFAVGLLELD